MGQSLLVMLSLPFALVGGVLFIWVLGYQWSVATAIGFAAPMVGGMVSSTVLTLVVIPAVYLLWKGRETVPAAVPVRVPASAAPAREEAAV